MRLHRTTILMLVFLLACTALLGACKKNPPPVEETPAATEMTPAPTPEPSPMPAPFSVTSIDLGKAIGADKKISEPATTFGPKDTIYASVSTDGASDTAKALKAKWTFGDAGQLVKEEEGSITPTGGPDTTEFHISKASGWPVGKYKVEIFVDGTSAGTKDFEVQK